jgi:preprotein translocase subunit SecA
VRPPWHDRAASALWHALPRALQRLGAARAHAGRRFVAEVRAHADAFAPLSDEQLSAQAAVLRLQLRRDGFAAALVARCFGLVQETAVRTLGKRHHDCQVMAGWALLQGTLVEMATGEGKTIAATLPVCTAALAGLPVHVITVNDYLATRDAQDMGPLYRRLGLSVGTVVHGLSTPQRRAAYGCDITYCTNKELAFDYLRDRVALGERSSRTHLALDRLRADTARAAGVVLRGLWFAIVDEADSVFVDDARTPLILSRMTDSGFDAAQCAQALDLAQRLQEGLHYTADLRLRRIRVTPRGIDRVAEESQPDAGFGARRLEEAVQQALSALLLYRRDQQYVVAEGKVQIVDESTGRVMPDRAWERGLHQMIEAKEGLALTAGRQTLGRITYQRLFRRYARLGGMTGTAREVSAEIGRVYGLGVVDVPLDKPSRRTAGGVRCLPTVALKWQAVADAVERLAVQAARPVLVGTRSVQASEELSAQLSSRGIDHVVLNAKQDAHEAEVVAAAGGPGRVTVATNMAGRGTDIALAPGVAGRGGLHVILTEYNESRRVDRQLFGRCARQGDPGSVEVIVSLQDELFTAQAGALARWLALRFGRDGPPPRWTALLRRVAQWRAERRNMEVRMQTLEHDRRLAQTLAFSGRGE